MTRTFSAAGVVTFGYANCHTAGTVTVYQDSSGTKTQKGSAGGSETAVVTFSVASGDTMTVEIEAGDTGIMQLRYLSFCETRNLKFYLRNLQLS